MFKQNGYVVNMRTDIDHNKIDIQGAVSSMDEYITAAANKARWIAEEMERNQFKQAFKLLPDKEIECFYMAIEEEMRIRNLR